MTITTTAKENTLFSIFTAAILKMKSPLEVSNGL